MGMKAHQPAKMMELGPEIKRIAAFKVGPEWEANVVVKQISIEALTMVRGLTIVLCALSLLLCLLLFIYHLLFKMSFKVELLLNFSIVGMVLASWLAVGHTMTYAVHWSAGLLLALCLLKVAGNKLVVVAVVLGGFVLFDSVEVRLFALLFTNVYFFVLSFNSLEYKPYFIYLGTCLMLYSNSKWYQYLYLH